MKQYSEDRFELRSRLTQKQIIDRLQEHTLKKKWLSTSWTNKDFIGHIEEESFSVISSSFPLPLGAACILRGKVGPASNITLTTTLHRAFRILFLIWSILMAAGFIFNWMREPGGGVGLFAIMLITAVGGVILRLYLHGMYVWARNDALKKLRQILELE